MRNFLRSTSFKILLTVAVVLLAGAIAAAALASGTSPLTSAVGTVFSPLSDAAAYISEKFDNFKGGFISSRSYMDRVEELEEQVADYQSKLVDYEKLQKQVEAYEKFLGVKEKNPDFQFVAGTVIGRDAADVFGSFVLNCGSADGVAVGDPVISGEYLIGIVNETSPTSCTVLSVCDPKFSAAAYEIRTGEAGYTQTTTKLGVQGVLKLSGLERDTAVAEGGIVCTSGVGGVFPRGLIIGTVTTVQKEEGDISYYAEVKPEIEISEVQDAFVITDFEGKGDA
ncbi:MAG TPA: rod shape-determining protein MreC [Candidatus Fimenecus excrementavium]|jgi:rod shape-determining protein MreC|nr:rod shape-determining protein MreC [Candidatus Fimenecus excrementavium]